MQADHTSGVAALRRMALRLLAVAALAAGFATTGAAETVRAKGPIVCEGRTYALCAVAECSVYNGVAYCGCRAEHGDSISAPLEIDGKDVCEMMAAGKRNGYLVSTYSLPPEVVKGGDKALYTCPAETSTGSYAQCDGGLCFPSTRGKRFPGLDKLDGDEMICACPITTADPSTAKTGYQIVGPYPCQKDFFRYCGKRTASGRTGSTIYVGAPEGTPRALTRQLYGSVPPLNQCRL